MSDNSVATGSHAFRLTKLIYTVSAVTLAYNICLLGGTKYFVGLIRDRDVDKWMVATKYGYQAILLLFLLAMLAVVLAYRPIRATLSWPTIAEKEQAGFLRNVGLGITGGLVSCVVAGPLLERGGGGMLGFIATTMVDAYLMHAASILMLLLLAAVLPVVCEMVFRGIIFRTLAEYSSVPAAVIASSLLFAYLWPVLNWDTSIILGVVSALLYRRTRTLTAPIIADAVMTLGSIPLAGLYRWVMR